MALSAAVALGLRAQRTRLPARFDPLGAVPPGPSLILTLELAKLAPFLAAQLPPSARTKLLGLEPTCGFEPLFSLERGALALPSRERDELALIFVSKRAQRELVECAQKVVAQRGGQPDRSELGRFVLVRDAKRPAGEIAVRHDGVIITSGGEYLKQSLAAASGLARADADAQLRDALHRTLRSRVGPSDVLLSWVPETFDAPLPGVRALAASASVRGGAQLSLRALLLCESNTGCSQVEARIESLASELLRARVRAVRSGAELELTGTVALEPLLSRLSESGF